MLTSKNVAFSTGMWGLAVLLLMTLVACEPQPAPEPAAPAASDAATTEGLDTSPEALAAYLLDLRARTASSAELAQQLPDLDRETAYQIQKLTLDAQLADGRVVRGWKMGGARTATPESVADPSYGYSLDSVVFDDSVTVSAGRFVNGVPQVEAELAFWIGADLPGPEVTRDEVIAAIDGVSGSVEFISQRLLPATDSTGLPINLAIADNLSHGGTVLGSTRVLLADIALTEEVAYTEVDGVEVARGGGNQIMHGDPLAAVVWLANELPKHGMMLQAGQFVITGSVYDNPTMQAGQQAAVHFSTLGTIHVGLE